MWSVGVILLCLLGGRYPFFRAPDDLSTLAEITTLLGTNAVRKAAANLGKLLTCSEERKPLDIVKVCEILRNNCKGKDTCDNTDFRAAEPCLGCHQRDVCVCLILPTQLGGTCQGSAQTSNSRKRLQTYESQKKGSVTSFVSTVSSPTADKNSKTRLIPNPSGNFAEVEGLSPVRIFSPLENRSQTPVHNNDLNLEEVILSGELSQGALCHDELYQNVALKPHCLNPSCASPPVYPPMVYNLLLRLLDPNPKTRITTEEALAHPFLNHQAMV